MPELIINTNLYLIILFIGEKTGQQQECKIDKFNCSWNDFFVFLFFWTKKMWSNVSSSNYHAKLSVK